jgi:hypothetical protein
MRTARISIAAALCLTVALSLGGCGGIIDEQAGQQFRQSLGSMSVTVFPTFIREGEQGRYDPESAQQIGEHLTSANLATVQVNSAEVPISSEWGMNQSKMLRESAADFSAYVQAHPIATDYALLAEYLLGGGGKVMGIHLYVVDAGGTVAYAVLQNSHHPEFQAVDPQSLADCTEVLLRALAADLGSGD